MITFGATLVQAWVNPFGQEAILGYVAIVKVMNLARIVLVGFAQTLTLMTAQLLAVKTYSAVKAVYRYCSNVSLHLLAGQLSPVGHLLSAIGRHVL
nr:hypothetical protein [Lactobacillus delbrueckii]